MGATYYKRKDRPRGRPAWVVVVRWQGAREVKTVHSEQDAKALVQMIHKQELAGVNVIETIRQARSQAAPPTAGQPVAFPALRKALPAWLERQVMTGEIRGGTLKTYRGRLGRWAFSHQLPDGRLLGDVPVNLVTREMLGAVIHRAREAGRSLGTLKAIRNPLVRYYAELIETKMLPGPNPAGDLRFFIGRQPHRPDTHGPRYFTTEEAPQLIATVRAAYPR
jgi:hypothetical protein